MVQEKEIICPWIIICAYLQKKIRMWYPLIKKDTLYKNSIEDSSNKSKPNERIIPSEFFPETPQNILGDNYKE